MRLLKNTILLLAFMSTNISAQSPWVSMSAVNIDFNTIRVDVMCNPVSHFMSTEYYYTYEWSDGTIDERLHEVFYNFHLFNYGNLEGMNYCEVFVFEPGIADPWFEQKSQLIEYYALPSQPFFHLDSPSSSENFTFDVNSGSSDFTFSLKGNSYTAYDPVIARYFPMTIKEKSIPSGFVFVGITVGAYDGAIYTIDETQRSITFDPTNDNSTVYMITFVYDYILEINLKQGSTNIADGDSYDYGDQSLGTHTDVVYTIENLGTTDLTLTTPLSLEGTHAGLFSIPDQPASIVAGGANTNFTVRFSPTSLGDKTATIAIGNNDVDENPYDLTLNGTGINANDYSDGPVSFGSAGHTYNQNLHLGTTLTSEASDYGSANANGDVDDGVVSFETWINGTVVGPGYLPDGTVSSVTMDDDTYAVLIQATNNTGTAAQLVGWIDWNRNGAFDDPGERSVTVLDGVTGNVPTGSNNVDVVVYWDGQTKNGTAAFARFRITTNASFKSPTSPSPTGNAGDGEVEDYQIQENALPVELSSFTVEETIGGVLCKWITESEIENLGFLLDRKTDGADWTEIVSYKTDSKLIGQGTTSSYTNYEYLDIFVEPNTTYEYRLADVDYNGIVTYHSVRTVTVEKAPLSSILEEFTVLPAYPNPFNPSTTITYGMATDNKVTIDIYDITGQLITTLQNGYKTQGWHSIIWNGNDNYNNQVPAGIYLSRITSGNDIKTTKLMFLK